MIRLDYISCFLTLGSTILIGKRLWQGWIIAGLNSVVICVIAVQTSQTGFIPANLFCIAIYGYNIMQWRKQSAEESHSTSWSGRLLRRAETHRGVRDAASRRKRSSTNHDRAARDRDRVRRRKLPAR